jgi:hypothetical protein
MFRGQTSRLPRRNLEGEAPTRYVSAIVKRVRASRGAQKESIDIALVIGCHEYQRSLLRISAMRQDIHASSWSSASSRVKQMKEQRSTSPDLGERRLAVFTLLVASAGAGYVAAHLSGALIGAAAMFGLLLIRRFRDPVLRLMDLLMP